MDAQQRDEIAQWLRKVADKLEADEPYTKTEIEHLNEAASFVEMMADDDEPDSGKHAAAV